MKWFPKVIKIEHNNPECFVSNGNEPPYCKGEDHPESFAWSDCIHCSRYESEEIV